MQVQFGHLLENLVRIIEKHAVGVMYYKCSKRTDQVRVGSHTIFPTNVRQIFNSAYLEEPFEISINGSLARKMQIIKIASAKKLAKNTFSHKNIRMSLKIRSFAQRIPSLLQSSRLTIFFRELRSSAHLRSFPL